MRKSEGGGRGRERERDTAIIFCLYLPSASPAFRSIIGVNTQFVVYLWLGVRVERKFGDCLALD